MRARRVKALIFYAVLFYFLYRYFAGGEAEPIPLPEQQHPSTALPEEPIPDRNFIIRAIFFVASIIPWAFSCIWTVLGWFWSALCFLWSVIAYVWTLFILVINGTYVAVTTHISYRNRRQDIQQFFEMGLIYLVIPIVVNWLLIRHEIAFNLLLPIYLTIFVAVNNGPNLDKTIPRNLVFFIVMCAIF